MKILETEKGWTVEHNGKSPVAIEGMNYFPQREVLTSAVEKRGLYIWSDGSIERTPEVLTVPPAKVIDDDAFEAAAPESSSGAPPTQDPPVDPDADKDRPKPSPKPTAPGNKKTGGRVTKAQAKRVSEKLAAHKGDNILTPEAVKALGGEKAVGAIKKHLEDAADKRLPKKPGEQPARGRGRPRLYSPEEAAERRRVKSREYAAKRSDEQKAAARERARKWREENPDKVKEAREKSMANRATRYETDAQFRERFNAYQREYKRTKRAEPKETE